MSIRTDVEELQGVKKEIIYLNKKRTALKKREKALEEKIALYLAEKNQPGVKFQGTAIIVEKREKPIRKNQKEKDQCVLEELEKNGIKNSAEILKRIKQAMQGEKILKQSLKIKTLKNSE